MVKQMINSKLEELFKAIENSDTYKEYKKMEEILDKDSEIKKIIEEIKDLEREATYLENNGDESYKEIDQLIRKKAEELNNKQVYQEYLNKVEEFNDELATSSKMIEDYTKEKVQ